VKAMKAIAAAAFAACLAAHTATLSAQSVELMPFGGYRFGGDFFELIAGHPLDVDGAPALGLVLNVPLSAGLQVEALVTHQRATLAVPDGPLYPSTRWHASVGHAQIGGLQELADGRVRPFLTGLLGLTRYAAEGDSEVRFTVGAGGGVKLFPHRHVGLRLDGRLHATFVDADARFVACGPAGCVGSLHVNVVWQAEFTAGVVFRLH
jgi:hypothetical protein